MRLFVGLDPTPELRAVLAGAAAVYRAQLGPAQWTLPADLHVTLQFLGEVPEGQDEVLRRALAGIQRPPVRLQLAGLGVFPDAQRPRLLWAGVTPSAALDGLAARVAGALHRIGYRRETRPFLPHLTLARSRSPKSLIGRLPPLATDLPAWGSFNADALILFETCPAGAPDLPRYLRRARFPLDTAAAPRTQVFERP